MDFLRDEDVPAGVAMLEAEIVALPDQPDRDHADAGPRVEPCVESAECRRVRSELYEAKSRSEERAPSGYVARDHELDYFTVYSVASERRSRVTRARRRPVAAAKICNATPRPLRQSQWKALPFTCVGFSTGWAHQRHEAPGAAKPGAASGRKRP